MKLTLDEKWQGLFEVVENLCIGCYNLKSRLYYAKGLLIVL